jgi:DNA-directed RNA polymerase subunit H (RpoH/RPB5)
MPEINSEFVSIVYKTRKNLLEQLKERGFNIEDYDNFTVGEINLLIDNEQLDMLIENTDGKKVYVKYSFKSINKKKIYDTYELLYKIDEVLNPETDELLYIVLNDPNESNLKIIKQIWDEHNIYVSIISLKRLRFNVLKHTMVPKHRIMNNIEIQEFKEKYNIKNEITELPEISRYDPVAVAIGLRPGQICEITRKSPTSINSYYYRVCV